MEDSISCSPIAEKRRSKRRTFHRKTKCESKVLKNTQNVEDLPADLTLMEALYDKESYNKSNFDYFNPFENELILAAADKVGIIPKSQIALDKSTSKGFTKLENLPTIEDQNKPSKQSCFLKPETSSTNVTTIQDGVTTVEAPFEITESELVRFCDEAEIDLQAKLNLEINLPKQKNSIVDSILEDFCGSLDSESEPNEEIIEKTPKGSKSIVDAILEDFCGSPFDESPPKVTPDDATPVFRYKCKPIRTYSGKRRGQSRRNIVTQLNLPQDDGNTSDSSGLSVQEDLSQISAPQLDTVDLNNSVKVCENLLNLSSYFSQISPTQKNQSNPQSKGDPLSSIISDILELKQKKYTLSRTKSLEFFYGFSDEESDSTIKELLEAEDEFLEKINCDSLCYEQIEFNSFTSNQSDFNNSVGNNEVKELISGSKECFTSECQVNNVLHEGLPSNSAQLPSKIEDQLFDDDDFWTDNECLLKYKTQKSHSNSSSSTIKSNALGHELNQNKNYDDIKSMTNVDFSTALISKSKHQENETILKNVEQEEQQILFNDIESLKTAIKKDSIELDSHSCNDEGSSKEKMKTDEMLNNIEVDERRKTAKEQKQLLEQLNGKSSSPLNLVGFSTASKKPIQISAEGKRKADLILHAFEQAEREQNEIKSQSLNNFSKKWKSEENSICPDSIILRPSTNFEKSFDISVKKEKNSSKPLSVSEEIYEKDQFQAINHPAKFEDLEKLLSSSTFNGFSTASKKPIPISDRGKLKASKFLNAFEQSEKLEEISSIQEKDQLHEINQPAKLEDLDKVLCSSTFNGFSTASKKPIPISDRGKLKASKFLNAFEQSEKLEEISSIQEKDQLHEINQPAKLEDLDKVLCSSTFNGFSTASKKPIPISDQGKLKANKFLSAFEQSEKLEEISSVQEKDQFQGENHYAKFDDLDKVLCSSTFNGFSTASKKPIPISDQGKLKANKFLSSFEQSEKLEEISSTSTSNSAGFSTAAKKTIHISAEAKHKADKILKAFEEAEKKKQLQDLTNYKIPDKESEEIKRKAQELLMDIEFLEEDFEEEINTLGKSSQMCEPSSQVFEQNCEGFQTASNKIIYVSDVAKERAQNLLKSIESEDLPQDFLECIQSDLKNTTNGKADGSAIIKNQTNGNSDNLEVLATTCDNDKKVEHLSNLFLAEDGPSLMQKRQNPPLNDLKKATVFESPRRNSCNERTTLDCKENSNLKKIKSLQLKENTSNSLISRKNLLSLSKRRKLNSPSEVSEKNPSKTPEKNNQLSSHSSLNSNLTPNLKEFFDSVSTSTPRLIRNVNQNIKDSPIDPDFRKINWDDSNSSLRACKTSFAADANMNYSQICPSPQERIERLKMYGEPPPVSPILMVNKCRPSGLRRGRSLMKP